jgi:undecaprenyl-diphosphatase
MPDSPGPRINLRPGPFFRAAADRLDVRSRKGFPVTAAGTIAVLAFLGFLSIVEDVVEPAAIAMDHATQLFVAAIRTPALTQVFRILTALGDVRVAIVTTLVAAMLLAAWGHPRRAGSVAILVLTGSLISTALKGFLDRARPVGFGLIAEPASPSFPSGHALTGVLLFGALALMLAVSRQPRWLRIWGSIGIALFGLSIGASRVYLGVHYSSDVLASWLLGLSMLATWSAAVLVWGRTQPPIEDRPVTTWGRAWWRWGLLVLGVLAIVLSLIDELATVTLL